MEAFHGRSEIAPQTIERSLPVTVSIGASMKDSLSDVMRSIQEADTALYLAKDAGRNQTRYLTPHSEPEIPEIA